MGRLVAIMQPQLGIAAREQRQVGVGDLGRLVAQVAAVLGRDHQVRLPSRLLNVAQVLAFVDEDAALPVLENAQRSHRGRQVRIGRGRLFTVGGTCPTPACKPGKRAARRPIRPGVSFSTADPRAGG